MATAAGGGESMMTRDQLLHLFSRFSFLTSLQRSSSGSRTPSGAIRVVDGDEKLAMPEVVALMTNAKEKIKLSFTIQSKKALLKKIMDIIERRWVKQIDHPLYGAALYSNPGILHPLIKADDDATVGQLRGCFLDVLGRMVEDEKTRYKINAQAMDLNFLEEMHFQVKWLNKIWSP